MTCPRCGATERHSGPMRVWGAAEMAWRLTTGADFTEGTGMVLITHRAVTANSNSNSRDSRTLFWPPWVLGTNTQTDKNKQAPYLKRKLELNSEAL